MAFLVETSAQADEDAASIREWLVSRFCRGRRHPLGLGLEEAIASLANMPLRCPVAPGNTEFPFEVRQLFHGRTPHVYRILFTVEDSRAYVLHIRHGRRTRLSEL